VLPDTTTPVVVAIDPMEARHWDSVRAIYQAGIDTGYATFASSPPASWDAWQRDHLNGFSVVNRSKGWYEHTGRPIAVKS
jgi:L-amino acid N-acyltransferase YncA